ncbi:hypothetical protein BDV18DRAFT_163863 [Aspergillus unguis]
MHIDEQMRFIWRGELPPQPQHGLPDPGATKLAGYNFAQLVNLMANFPQHAQAVYIYGLDSGFWGGDPRISNEDELLQQHEAWNPAQPPPIPQHIVTANIAGRVSPIEQLVAYDRLHALAALHDVGIWHPLGYAADGDTWLNKAAFGHITATGIRKTSVLVTNYILYRARTTTAFGEMPPQSTRLTDSPMGLTHFDYVVQYGDYKAFKKWWSVLTQQRHAGHVRATTFFNAFTQQILCRTVSKVFAEDLRTLHRVELDRVNDPSMRDTVWHLAVENRNTGFMETVARSQLHRIDDRAGVPMTPLDHARMRRRLGSYKKLLQLGASPNSNLRNDILDLTLVRDPFFRATVQEYRDINAAGLTGRGTLLHDVITALHHKLHAITNSVTLTAAQKAHQRRRWTARAKSQIWFIRRGSRYGRPDLAAVNTEGRTAMALARYHNLGGIYDALVANPARRVDPPVVPPVNNTLPAPVAGSANRVPASGHRYHLRNRSRFP